MDYDKVLKTARKLVHFEQDAKYISKAFVSYYAETEKYDDRFSLAINIFKFLKQYDSVWVSCALPYDVLHILLYDDTLLSQNSVVEYEMESIKDFRKNYGNIGECLGNSKISQDELNAVNSARCGITQNLSWAEIKARKDLIDINVVVPLREVWIEYFIKRFRNKGEQWVKEKIHDLIMGDVKFHTLIPLPSYLSYLDTCLVREASSDSNKGNVNEASEEVVATPTSPDEGTVNFASVQEINKNFLKDIGTYLSSMNKSMNKSKKLNSIHFKTPAVIFTFVRGIIQENSHKYDFVRGAREPGKSNKEDLGFLLASPPKLMKIIKELRKSSDKKDEKNILSGLRKMVQRLEHDALLVLLKGQMITGVFTTPNLKKLVNVHKEKINDKIFKDPSKYNSIKENSIKKFLYDSVIANDEFCFFISEEFSDNKEHVIACLVNIFYKKYLMKVYIPEKRQELSQAGDGLVTNINFIAPGSDNE